MPNDYTVEVRNRFKELDLIDRVPDELWRRFMTLYRRQGSRPSPWKRNANRQNGCVRRPYKQLRKEEKQKAKEKGKIYPFECRVPRKSKERYKSLPQLSMQRNRGKQKNGKDQRSLQEN